MPKVGEYDVTRHGDGLYYVSYMAYKISPGFHDKGRARLFAKLVKRGVAPADIILEAPGSNPTNPKEQ